MFKSVIPDPMFLLPNSYVVLVPNGYSYGSSPTIAFEQNLLVTTRTGELWISNKTVPIFLVGGLSNKKGSPWIWQIQKEMLLGLGVDSQFIITPEHVHPIFRPAADTSEELWLLALMLRQVLGVADPKQVLVESISMKYHTSRVARAYAVCGARRVLFHKVGDGFHLHRAFYDLGAGFLSRIDPAGVGLIHRIERFRRCFANGVLHLPGIPHDFW